MYKLKKIVGFYNFSAQFIKIISHYEKIGYNIIVLQQTACLVVNPITVAIFDLTTAGDWDCVAAVERLPILHYSVDFIFLSFGIMGFIVEL